MRREILASAPRLPSICEQPPTDLDPICAAIPPDAFLVEYFVLDGFDRTELAFYVLEHDGLKAHGVIGAPVPLVACVDRFRADVISDAETATGSELAALLLDPIWDAYPCRRARMLVVPRVRSASAPVLRAAAQLRARRPPLAEELALTVLPSAAFLAQCAGMATPGG